MASDDQAEFDGGANNQVVVRLGTRSERVQGRDAAASHRPGCKPNPQRASPSTSQSPSEAAGTTVTNQGFLDYTAATLDKSFTYDTNVVDTPVAGGADLSITKSASSTTAAPGGNLVYTLLAQNHGPRRRRTQLCRTRCRPGPLTCRPPLRAAVAPSPPPQRRPR